MNAVVPKPWGYEYCAFDNGKAAVWIMHIARGRSTSLHCHPRKRTRLIALQGTVTFEMDRAQCQMAPLQQTEIAPGKWHRTSLNALGPTPYSENGAFVMEIEEPSDKGDIVRAADKYGREGKPIESLEVPCGTEMLRLSHREQSLIGYRFKLESTLGGEKPDLALDLGGEVLGIYKEPRVRVADWIANFVRAKGVDHVFGVVGGGAMHLNDAFRDFFKPMHHEQAAAFAAEAYARLRGFGCCLVTTGPGGTNALTGVACAWNDSIPLMVISGQVTTQQLRDRSPRAMGVQGLDIVPLVQHITKYARTITEVADVKSAFETAWEEAIRKPSGPAWLDVPLDIQGALL